MLTMTGEHDLEHLLRALQPTLAHERYVFVVLAAAGTCTGNAALAKAERVPADRPPADRLLRDPATEAWALIREPEGITAILDSDTAARWGLAATESFGRITLRVHSSLTAVGLTAAVAGCLAGHGISANVVAGYYHDHLFVPEADAERALAALEALSQAKNREK